VVKPICRDVMFLKRKSLPATEKDKKIIEDLIDTLKHHSNECVGMAANMIGENKRIIIAHLGFFDEIMVNPVIVEKDEPYETKESCLSLVGFREVTRYNRIKVEYLNKEFEQKVIDLQGFSAQIVQHECDHLEGIIV